MEPEPRREVMLAALEAYLSKKRLVTITRVALAGRPQPRRVNGTVPDMEGVTEIVGRPVFGVAEKCDTYASSGSKDRLDGISRVAGAEVFLAVPYVCYNSARRFVEESFPGRNVTVLPYRKKETTSPGPVLE